MHFYVKKYISKQGVVIGEAKNGMLQIKFKTHTRNIPAGCVSCRNLQNDPTASPRIL